MHGLSIPRGVGSRATPARRASRRRAHCFTGRWTYAVYTLLSRRVFNAPPQAMIWSSMSLTDFSWCGDGLKPLRFSIGGERQCHLDAYVSDLQLGHHPAANSPPLALP
jgi:hypothetical protein